jgi:hypothetical protein
MARSRAVPRNALRSSQAHMYLPSLEGPIAHFGNQVHCGLAFVRFWTAAVLH